MSLDLAAGKVRQNQHLGTESSPGYGALDSYGRLLDMHVKNAAGDTLFRSQYTYDIAGNRKTAKLTQALTTSGSQDNVKSQHNDYDNLDRLIGTQVGSLNTSGTIIPASLLQTDTWNLDLLGNWTGSITAAGRVTVTPSGTTNFGYDVDQRNRMTALTGGPSNSNRTGVRYDASGNLQFDGTYFYQYDAWNRLIQVNAAAWQTGGGGQNSGTILIGNLIKNYAFDGLGRLARTLSPYPNPAAAGGFNRTERFYYDGIRRIQEVITDPVSSSKQADESGDANLQQLADQTTPPGADTQGTPVGLEVGQIISGGPAQVTQWLDREYVWGPGDGPGGVDELLVQYDNQRVPWWVIQDEGGDVAALCDLGAANQDGRVVGQYTYDAYGSPLSFDWLYTHPQMHCGHKGLFVDRLDVGVVVSAGGAESTRISPGGSLLCHNRNRTYSPKLGRFLQQDPNASGEVLLLTAALHGQAQASAPSAFVLTSIYGNGGSLYEYLGSATWGRHDDLGLDWDPFEAVDDFLAEDIATKHATMEAAGQYWSQVGMMALSAVPVVGSFVSGYELGQRLAMGKSLELMDYVTLAAHALPVAGAVAQEGINVVQRAKDALQRLRFQYAMRGTKARGVLGQEYNELREMGLMRGGAACSLCLAATSITWTPSGVRPINELNLGDLVTSAQGDGVHVQAPIEAVAVIQELAATRWFPVHLLIDRPNGTITNVLQLVPEGQIALLGLDQAQTGQTSIWLPDAGAEDDHGGWARVLNVGGPVTLGNGIAIPTLYAAPITKIMITTRAALLGFALESSRTPLRLTENHQLWSVSQCRWQSAKDIREGDLIQTSSGSSRVQSVTRTAIPEVVYNLTIAGGHTFYVGEAQVWVHNSGCFDMVNVTKVQDRFVMRAPKKRGQAPIGVDGKPLEIHHWNQSPEGPFTEILKRDHLEIPTQRPGLSAAERKMFNAARRRYWEQQWDSGRFRRYGQK